MKHIVLSEQDRQVLLHLHKFVYLSKEFIDAYIYNDPRGTSEIKMHERTVYRRLQKMEEAGYITSFSVPIKENSKRPSFLYTLTKFGVGVVKELTGYVHWKEKWSYEVQLWYMHTLTLAEVVKNFEYKANPAKIVVKEFISESRAYFEYYEQENGQSKKHNIRPDGILVIGSPHDDDNNWGIMIEMERSYASRQGTIRKLEQYNRFFRGVKADKDYLYKDYQERMQKFDLQVGFEYPINIHQWRILFVGNNDSMGDNIIFKHLRGLESEVKLRSASKNDLIENPYRKVYRALEDSSELGNL